MSTETTTPPAEAPKKKPMMLAIVLMVGIVLGGGAGVMVAMPLLGRSAAEAAVVDEYEDEYDENEAAEAAPPAKGGRSSGPPVLYNFENMVLNPAETAGTRFLMVSAAYELRDAKVLEHMKTRDIEMRDLMLGVLAEKTVDELTDVSQREAIKDELRVAIDRALGRGAVRRVYLHQFVIQ